MKFMTVVLMFACSVIWAQERFDKLVRSDFFAGFAGDSKAFERAMSKTEETLAKNPKHAEAKVWHGAGVFFRSALAFEKGDYQNGLTLWQRGLGEMEAAVKLEPDKVSVLIPRGATLITSSRFAPPDHAKPILATGVADFEKVLKIQEPFFSTLPVHARGELLIGLADGWNRLGDKEKAKRYFERITRDLKGSTYEQKAEVWLEGKPETKSHEFFNCAGCHLN